jgi:hypothetical protein
MGKLTIKIAIFSIAMLVCLPGQVSSTEFLGAEEEFRRLTKRIPNF